MKLLLIDKAFLLKKTFLFESIDFDLLLTLSEQSLVFNYKEKERIFSINQKTDFIYLIVRGLVLIQDKQQKKLALLKAGEFFGDEAVFQGKQSYEAINAGSHLTLLALLNSHFLRVVQEWPSVALALLEVYSQNSRFQ